MEEHRVPSLEDGIGTQFRFGCLCLCLFVYFIFSFADNGRLTKST